MANLIILEGLSRTGKSSIAKALENKGFRSISVKDKMPAYIENLHDFYHGMHIISNEIYRTFPNENFVIDRSFLSELVYSKFFNRKTHSNQSDSIKQLLQNNFLLVYLSNTHQRYIERGPKDRILYSEEDFKIQKDLFDQNFEEYKNREPSELWQSRFVQIDSSETSIEEAIKIIEDRFEKIS